MGGSLTPPNSALEETSIGGGRIGPHPVAGFVARTAWYPQHLRLGRNKPCNRAVITTTPTPSYEVGPPSITEPTMPLLESYVDAPCRQEF